MQENRPTWARRVLARFLRTCREERGMSPTEAAAAASITPSKLSRIETGALRAEVGTALFLMRIYGVPQDQQDMMEELAHAARRRGFWHRKKSGIPEWFQMYVMLESEAEGIYSYEPDLIPGFMQTTEYTEEIVASGVFLPQDEEEATHRIRVRGKRQSLILDHATPASVVLSETVLRRVVGGPDVMHRQLDRLLEFQKRDHLKIQVLPFSRGNHPGNYGRFIVLNFPKPHSHSVVYTEYANGAIYLEEQSEIETYTTMFKRLQEAAFTVDESSELIRECMDHI